MNKYRNLRTGAEIETHSELISPDWEPVNKSPKKEPEEDKNNGNRSVRKRK